MTIEALTGAATVAAGGVIIEVVTVAVIAAMVTIVDPVGVMTAEDVGAMMLQVATDLDVTQAACMAALDLYRV